MFIQRWHDDVALVGCEASKKQWPTQLSSNQDYGPASTDEVHFD